MQETHRDADGAAVKETNRWRRMGIGDWIERRASLVFIAPAVFRRALADRLSPRLESVHEACRNGSSAGNRRSLSVSRTTSTRFQPPGFTRVFSRHCTTQCLATLIPTTLGLGAALAFNERFFCPRFAAVGLRFANDGDACRGGADLAADVPSRFGRVQLPI